MTSYPLRDGYQDDWTWNVKNKEQEVKLSDEDPDRATFHMRCGIRGTHQLKCRKHYWEVTFKNINSSQCVYLGVGNNQTRLSNKCCSNHSCLCNPKNWTVIKDIDKVDVDSHNGYVIPFDADRERTIGMLLDNQKKTFTYYEDGTRLESCPLVHLSKVINSAEGLFPIMVARKFTELTFGIRLVDIFTLQDRCRKTIVRTISKKSDIDQLPIPTKIKAYLKDYDEVKM